MGGYIVLAVILQILYVITAHPLSPDGQPEYIDDPAPVIKRKFFAPEDEKRKFFAPEDEKRKFFAPEDEKRKFFAPEDEKRKFFAPDDSDNYFEKRTFLPESLDLYSKRKFFAPDDEKRTFLPDPSSYYLEKRKFFAPEDEKRKFFAPDDEKRWFIDGRHGGESGSEYFRVPNPNDEYFKF